MWGTHGDSQTHRRTTAPTSTMAGVGADFQDSSREITGSTHSTRHHCCIGPGRSSPARPSPWSSIDTTSLPSACTAASTSRSPPGTSVTATPSDLDGLETADSAHLRAWLASRSVLLRSCATLRSKGWTKSLLTALGLAGAAVLAVLYAPELFSHSGPPPTVRWLEDAVGRSGLIAVNLLASLAFLLLLPYRSGTRHIWRSKGAFVAFVIALMTEMFGWPLLVFLLAPLVEIPSMHGARHLLGHWGPILGTWLTLLGVVLVVLGWKRVHAAEGLVTDGVYRFVRHPQYTGLLLFTVGWLLHWPTLLTFLLWPILAMAYVWLARREERELASAFGDAYRGYAEKTPRFFPWPRRR